MDLGDLVQLVVPREEGHEGEQLEKDTADAPNVHLEVVVAVRKETLRCSVPPGGDVLREGLFLTDAPTTAEVGQLDHLVRDEDVLGLDVAVEDAVGVHVFHRLDHLKHIILRPLLRDALLRLLVGLVQFVQVHVHELEDQGQSSGGLVIEHLLQLDDVREGREFPQGLDLAEVVHLLDRVEVVLHALDGHVLPCLDALGLEYL